MTFRVEIEITALQDQATGDAAAYQRMTKRARKWKRRWLAARGADLVAIIRERNQMAATVTGAIRERDEARVALAKAKAESLLALRCESVDVLSASLEAMTARARRMREALMDGANCCPRDSDLQVGLFYAAGEPIP